MPDATRQLIEAGQWLGGFVLLAVVLRFLWNWLVHRRLRENTAGMILARAMQGLLISAVLLIGIARAAFTLPYFEAHPRLATLLTQGLSIAWIILFAIVGARAINAGFAIQELGAESNKTRAEVQDLRTRHSLYRKILLSMILVVATIYALRVLGADLTPLLAGGTIGGIVLGLALQESLSNFFSGIFLNMDRPASVGDLVRLENGQEGFVEEIGWRSTKVRLWSDAMLVIPNNKFASSWLINFHQPAQDVWVSVDCTIEYGSDLNFAEGVAVEAAKAAMATIGHESEREPYVRWREFGESGVILRVFLPATDPETQDRMRSECIKEIDRRFAENGIRFAYPVRKILN